MVIKDVSALESCVNEHASASGEEHTSKFALQDDTCATCVGGKVADQAGETICTPHSTTTYCAGMLVQILRVYRKHCQVDNNEGTEAWLPIAAAFDDPKDMSADEKAEWTMMTQSDEPNVISERTLVGDVETLN